MEARRSRFGALSVALAVAIASLGVVVVNATPAGAATPNLRVGNTTIYEGDLGTRIARVMISLDEAAPAEGVTAHWATTSGTATGGIDYRASAGNLYFKTGQTTRYAKILIKPDGLAEGPESFSVTLSSVVGATVGDGTGTVTIADEEGGSPAAVSIGSATVAEGDSGPSRYVWVPVTLDTPPGANVTVNYTTSGGDATVGVDYFGHTGTLKFGPKARSNFVLVYLNGDTAAEGDETFFVTLSSPVNATIGAGTGVVTIVDND
jgi:large repetitive protein